MIYVFNKRFYSLDDVDAMTARKAHYEAKNDFVGTAMEYETFDEFATDFNNGCFSLGRYIIKKF